jgi:hypothetical protein
VHYSRRCQATVIQPRRVLQICWMVCQDRPFSALSLAEQESPVRCIDYFSCRSGCAGGKKREPILNTFFYAKVNGRKIRKRVVRYSRFPTVADLCCVWMECLYARGSGHYGAGLDGW